VAVLADIATGNHGFADVMFLVAFIVFLGAAIVAWSIQPRVLWATVVSVGLAAMALAWLVL